MSMFRIQNESSVLTDIKNMKLKFQYKIHLSVYMSPNMMIIIWHQRGGPSMSPPVGGPCEPGGGRRAAPLGAYLCVPPSDPGCPALSTGQRKC